MCKGGTLDKWFLHAKIWMVLHFAHYLGIGWSYRPRDGLIRRAIQSSARDIAVHFSSLSVAGWICKKSKPYCHKMLKNQVWRPADQFPQNQTWRYALLGDALHVPHRLKCKQTAFGALNFFRTSSCNRIGLPKKQVFRFKSPYVNKYWS